MEDLTAKQECASAFDAHHAPSNEIIEKCVHCGFCLPVCPTYVLWGQEMDSPRGRIYLMKMASAGATEMNSTWVSHFDSCLGCMACMTACPSGVDYGKLIEATRAQIERKTERSPVEELHRRFMFETFTRPERLRRMRLPLLAYQKSGLRAVVRGLGLLKLLPKKVRAMEALLPKLGPREAVAEVTPAAGTKRRRVGLLLGCVQREFFPQVNAATARVLAKEYGHLLRDDPDYADRGRVFAAKCRDISEVLAGLEPRATRHRLKLRVAFHDSCHLQHAQGVRSQPRALLSSIPGLELVEIPEAAICCGSAGIFNLVQPDAANELGDRKAQLIEPLKADVVATGNPGCILQMQSALARHGPKIPVVHTIQLVDASIRGMSMESLRS